MVERRGIVVADVKIAVINQQITVNGGYSQLANLPQHLPEPFSHQVGVAVALQQQISLENTVCDLAQQVHVGFPGVGRLKRIQRNQRGQHFLNRRRISRYGVIPRQ